MRLDAEYAVTARVLAQRFANPRERLVQQSKMRSLPRMEDGAAGFLKARTASFLKSLVLNCEQVPADKVGDFCKLLMDAANFLLILPDAAAGTASGRRLRSAPRPKPAPEPGAVAFRPLGYVRPVPERDE